TPELVILSIKRRGSWIVMRGLSKCRGSHDQSVQSLDTPPTRHKLGGQPIEQLWMSWLGTTRAEVIGRSHKPLAEMVKPDAIDHNSSGQRIPSVSEPCSESDAAL